MAGFNPLQAAGNFFDGLGSAVHQAGNAFTPQQIKSPVPQITMPVPAAQGYARPNIMGSSDWDNAQAGVGKTVQGGESALSQAFGKVQQTAGNIGNAIEHPFGLGAAPESALQQAHNALTNGASSAQAQQPSEEETLKQYQPFIQSPIIPDNGRDNAQTVLKALNDEGILNPKTAAYALATIKHETGGTFQPVREGFYLDNQYGQTPGTYGQIIAGKNNYSGGNNYYGRGYIQLTHDYNYKNIGQRIGMGDQLVKNPDLALKPEVAAKIFAAFMKDKGVAQLVNQGDFYGARAPINGQDDAANIAQQAQDLLQ